MKSLYFGFMLKRKGHNRKFTDIVLFWKLNYARDMLYKQSKFYTKSECQKCFKCSAEDKLYYVHLTDRESTTHPHPPLSIWLTIWHWRKLCKKCRLAWSYRLIYISSISCHLTHYHMYILVRTGRFCVIHI